MHWAAHGQTAAEVIYSRVDATQPNMGMTNWVGSRISKSEAEIAKNYLTAEELDLLNRIVTLYLDFAELQAIQRKAMAMHDWICKLDDFLKLSDRDILTRREDEKNGQYGAVSPWDGFGASLSVEDIHEIPAKKYS